MLSSNLWIHWKLWVSRIRFKLFSKSFRKSGVILSAVLLLSQTILLPALASDDPTEPQEEAGASTPAVPETKRTGSAETVPVSSPTFLWKATKGNDTIYLLGTIHGAMSQFYPLPSAIDQALDESKHLMVEIAIDKVDPTKVAKTVHELGQYTPPDHLSKHLTPETKKVFEQFLDWSGGTWEMYEKYKPFYAAGMASQSKRWVTEATKFRSSLGLDLYFLARAREAGKSISDLETVEQQLHIEADLSEAAQDRLLRTSILHMSEVEAQLKGYLEAWKSGDTEKMEALAKSRTKDYPELREYEKALLDDRNFGMLNKIKLLSKTKPGPHFVAVGAAHLVGPAGLVSLFEKDGWKVDRVSSDASTGSVSASAKTDNKIYPERFKIWFPIEPRRLAEKDTVRYEAYEPPNGAYLVCVFTSPTEPRDWPVPPPLMLDKLVSIFKPDPGTRKSFALQGYPGREIECSGPGLTQKTGGANSKNVAATSAPAGKAGAEPAAAKSGPDSSKPSVEAAKPSSEVASKTGSVGDKKSGMPGQGFGLGAAFAKVQAKDVKARIRVYLAGRRFYLLCAVGGKTFLETENVSKFFDSLELLSN